MSTTKVTLVDSDNESVAWVNVQWSDKGIMPPLLQYEGKLYKFDSGLQHCGERYNEVPVVTITPDMVAEVRVRGWKSKRG